MNTFSKIPYCGLTLFQCASLLFVKLYGAHTGEQVWHSGEITRFPLLWPGFKSHTQCHLWAGPCITRRAGGGGGRQLPLPWKLNVFAGLFLVAILVRNLYMEDLCEGVWSLPPQTNNPGYGPDELSLSLVLVLQSEKFFSTKTNTSKFKFKKRNLRVIALSVTRLKTKSIYLLIFYLFLKFFFYFLAMLVCHVLQQLFLAIWCPQT